MMQLMKFLCDVMRMPCAGFDVVFHDICCHLYDTLGIGNSSWNELLFRVIYLS